MCTDRLTCIHRQTVVYKQTGHMVVYIKTGQTLWREMGLWRQSGHTRVYIKVFMYIDRTSRCTLTDV